MVIGCRTSKIPHFDLILVMLVSIQRLLFAHATCLFVCGKFEYCSHVDLKIPHYFLLKYDEEVREQS